MVVPEMKGNIIRSYYWNNYFLNAQKCHGIQIDTTAKYFFLFVEHLA